MSADETPTRVEPLGYVNVYREEYLDGYQLVVGGSDVYDTAEEALESSAREFADHVGVFALLPVGS